MAGFLVHPKKSKGERLGRTTRYRCQFCRFPVNAEQRKNERVDEPLSGNVQTGTDPDITVTASSGCPFCGALNWSDRVPPGKVEAPEDRVGFKGRPTFRRRKERF